MVKSNKNELTYLQMPLPEGAKDKTSVRVNWSGLNKRYDIDTGELA